MGSGDYVPRHILGEAEARKGKIYCQERPPPSPTYLRAWISGPYTSRAESTTRFVLTSLLVLETEQSRFSKFEFAFSGGKIKRLKGI